MRIPRRARPAAAAVAAAAIALMPCEPATAGDEEVEISPRELGAMIDLDADRVFYGGMMLAGGDSLAGPVAVVSGVLDIQHGAVLAGDAWVINGRLIMTGKALLDGNVFLVNSPEYLSRDASITGRVRRYYCQCRLDDSEYERSGRVVFVERRDPESVEIEPSLLPGRPTRVDYELFRVGLTRINEKHEDPYLRASAHLLVPLWKESGGHLGFDAWAEIPLRGGELALRLSGFKRTLTNDSWMLSRMENGFFVMMSGDDYCDYWETRGAETDLIYRWSEVLSIDCSLSLQEDVSLDARPIPSLLRGTDRFRPNPPIDEGTRFAAGFSILYDSREDEVWRNNAWSARIGFEKGFADGPGDLSYEMFDVDVRRYRYLPWDSELGLRMKMFTSFGPLPAQMTRSLNGYAGVRGASDRPFPVSRGDRLALFSVELRRRMPDLPFLRAFFTRWHLLAFSDIGLLALAEDEDSPFGFLDVPMRDYVKTAGLGISGASFLPYVGIYAAQDLDRDSFDPRFILRFERSF